MTYSFHPEAEDEFNKAIEYYEETEPCLGYDFAVEVYSAIQRSVAFPKAWAVLEGEVRRSLVNPISVWSTVLRGTGWIVHCCCYESSSRSRLLERQKVSAESGRLVQIAGDEDRYLRVVLLPDGETVHNAFFDRGHKA